MRKIDMLNCYLEQNKI